MIRWKYFQLHKKIETIFRWLGGFLHTKEIGSTKITLHFEQFTYVLNIYIVNKPYKITFLDILIIINHDIINILTFVLATPPMQREIFRLI